METLQRTANRGSISTGYDIDNSIKLEADNVEFMDRAISTTGNRKTWTHSSWVKRTEISFAGDGFGHTFFFGGAYGSEACILRFNTGTTAATLDTLQIDIGFGGTLSRSHTSQVFRDTSAWYHIVLAVDTTQSTATDRFKLYVNGELVTSYYSRNNPAQNFDTSNNYQSSGYYNNVGAYKSGGTTYGKFCGYIAESYNIDGSALAPTAFGEFDEDSGIWKPKEYTGSFPNNSWYLKFDDSGALGADSSGNSYTFTLNNITAADQATDTPTNNFATLNPLMANAGPANYLPITEGGTKAVNAAAAYKIANSTFGVTSGKWYWEVKATDVNGVTAIGVTMPHYWDTDYTLGGCIYYGQTGQRYNNSSASAFGATYTDGDIISFALDMDATPPTMEVYKNNVSQGNLMAGLSINGAGGAFLPVKEDGYFPKIVGYNANTFECNFGGYTTFTISSAASDENGYGTSEYAPPTGYYALCTKNLAEYG